MPGGLPAADLVGTEPAAAYAKAAAAALAAAGDALTRTRATRLGVMPGPGQALLRPADGDAPAGRVEQGGGMRRGRMATPVVERSAFAGFRFPPEVITLPVRWYLRYALSYRDVAELLAERGIEVDHVSVYRWVQRFSPLFVEAARPCRHAPGDRWFADETCVKVAGRWCYLYRAIGQFGQVIDVMVSQRRDLAAARRFFARALSVGLRPTEVTTDHASAYVRVLEELAPADRGM
jgi:transposase-like protein